MFTHLWPEYKGGVLGSEDVRRGATETRLSIAFRDPFITTATSAPTAAVPHLRRCGHRRQPLALAPARRRIPDPGRRPSRDGDQDGQRACGRHLDEAPETSRGGLESHRIESAILGGQIGLDVYLPHGYGDADDRRYPVAYVHGGPSTRERSRIPNSLDHLIGKTVEPVIVVFANIQGPRYGEAFVGEVVPFIDGRYRTVAAPEGRANVGGGWWGFPTVLITLSRRDLFAKMGIQSVFLFTRMEDDLKPLLEGIGENPPQSYLDWGRYDLRSPHESWGMVAVNRELAEWLRRNGVGVVGGEVPDGTGWSSWHNRTDRMFEALFPLR